MSIFVGLAMDWFWENLRRKPHRFARMAFLQVINRFLERRRTGRSAARNVMQLVLAAGWLSRFFLAQLSVFLFGFPLMTEELGFGGKIVL